MLQAGQHIVVANHHAAARALLVQRMREAGHRVLEAEDTHMALQMAQSQSVRVMLCAHDLPGLNAPDFYTRLRNAAASLVILQTLPEPVHPEDRVRALRHGADACVAEEESEEALAHAEAALRRGGQAETALRKSEGRFRLVEEAVKLGVWFCDLPFDTLHWNANVKKHFFLEPDAAVTLDTFYERMHPDDREPTRQAIDRALTLGGLYDTIFRTCAPDGSQTHYIRALGHAFYNSEGKAVHFDGITVDMTEHKEAEEAIRQANKRKDEFLATMSHEIRTPMNAIIGLSHILAMSEPLSVKQQECIRTLQASGQAMLALINDLLDIAKIENDEVTFESVPFSLHSVAEEAVRVLQPRAQEKGLSLRLEYAEGAPRLCVGDPLRVRQILSNLLSNAVKFTERGEIGLRISATPEGMRIAVRDTGIGIAPDRVESIFSKFCQADMSVTRKYGGTGLGLAITRALVERLKGRIEVESREGEGSVFLVDLPLESAEPVKRPERADAAEDPNKPFILLVEDYPPNVLVATCLLDALDVQYHVAQNGQEALDMAENRRYDLILMDVQMPVVDGYTATQRLRERETAGNAPATPIIGITAYALSGDKEKCLAAGMNDYISKPFNTAELKGKIVTLLGQGAQRQAS